MGKTTHNFCFSDQSRNSFGKVMPAIQLRSKTLASLGKDANQELVEAFEKSCYEFCDNSFKEARQFLWKMKFYREEALNCLGFTSHLDKPALLFLTESQAEKLYNELRYQYSKKHEGFLKVEVQPYCKEELAALKKAVSSDPVVYFSIVSVCEQSYGHNGILNDCIGLFSSDQDSLKFKAFRNLGFSKETASCLLPYSKEISNLLKAYVDSYKEPQIITPSEDDEPSVDSPKEPENLQEISTSHEEQQPEQSISSETSDTDTISVDVLLKNKENICEFIKLSKVLNDSNIDCMKVLKKASAIESFFDAVEGLSN